MKSRVIKLCFLAMALHLVCVFCSCSHRRSNMASKPEWAQSVEETCKNLRDLIRTRQSIVDRMPIGIPAENADEATLAEWFRSATPETLNQLRQVQQLDAQIRESLATLWLSTADGTPFDGLAATELQQNASDICDYYENLAETQGHMTLPRMLANNFQSTIDAIDGPFGTFAIVVLQHWISVDGVIHSSASLSLLSRPPVNGAASRRVTNEWFGRIRNDLTWNDSLKKFVTPSGDAFTFSEIVEVWRF